MVGMFFTVHKSMDEVSLNSQVHNDITWYLSLPEPASAFGL